jgi:hypothetical protein
MPLLESDETRFDRLIKEYREWIERHKGSETTFFKTRIFDGVDIETIPMYSDSSTSQIKYNIKKGHIENTISKT